MSKGKGREIGLQLRAWLETQPEGLRSGQALSNRLMDALGSEEALRAPIRDLAGQALLLQVLHSQGARQRSALSSLQQQLATTYTPAVLQELLDLLEAATGVMMPRSATEAPEQPGPNPGTSQASSQQPATEWVPILLAIAPGMALSASGALVLAWLGQELDRALFEGWGWSGGVVLVVVLGLLQALSLGPLKVLRRSWPLDDQQALQPRQAWCWLGAAWIHERGLEAGLNLLVLLVVIGDSAAQLGDVVLRYSLTALATLIPAVILTARWQLQRQWSGSAGPISALIALAAGLSLLQGRALTFDTPLFSVPAWVLMLVVGALQLNWQLPSGDSERNGTPLQRLLGSQWAWGLLLGLSWALLTWGQELMKGAGTRH
jgi:hypothetical protein